MTPFIIFVLILTFGYLIYFTVMITLDLHGKKDERKVEEENIDVICEISSEKLETLQSLKNEVNFNIINIKLLRKKYIDI